MGFIRSHISAGLVLALLIVAAVPGWVGLARLRAAVGPHCQVVVAGTPVAVDAVAYDPADRDPAEAWTGDVVQANDHCRIDAPGRMVAPDTVLSYGDISDTTTAAQVALGTWQPAPGFASDAWHAGLWQFLALAFGIVFFGSGCALLALRYYDG